MTQSWCGRAGGVDGPARVMAIQSCRPHPPTSTSTSTSIRKVRRGHRAITLQALSWPLCCYQLAALALTLRVYSHTPLALTLSVYTHPHSPTHTECKVFQRVGLHSTFYTDEDMLARFPLTPADDTRSSRDNVPLGSSCSLCGKDDRQEDMTRTRCCNQV
jgi:hypothetical protein